MSDNSIQFDLELTTKAFEVAIAQATKAAEGFSKGISKVSEEASNSLGDAGKAGKSAGEEVAAGGKEATSAWEIFKGVLGAEAIAGAFDFMKEAAHKLFDTFVVEGVKGAEESEAALTKLRSALLVSGDAANGTLKEFQEFSEEIQKNSTVDKDAAISQLALAKQYGLTNEQAKQVVTTAVDMASRGYDLETSTKQLSESFSGQAGKLAKLNPLIRDLTEEQLKAGAASELIGAQFAGSAAEKVKTFEGAIDQTKNTFGELQKAIGFIITQNPALTGAIQQANDLFKQLTEAVTQNSGSLKELVTSGVEALVSAVNTTIETGKSLVSFWNENETGIKTLAVGLEAAAVSFAAYILVTQAGTIAMAASETAVAAFNFVLAASPIGLTITAIAALAAGVYYASQNFEELVGTVSAVVAEILTTLLPTIQTTLSVLASLASVFDDDLASSIISASDTVSQSIDNLNALQDQALAQTEQKRVTANAKAKADDDQAAADKLNTQKSADDQAKVQTDTAISDHLKSVSEGLKTESDRQKEKAIADKNARDEEFAALKKLYEDEQAAKREARSNYDKEEKAWQDAKQKKLEDDLEAEYRAQQTLYGALRDSAADQKKFDERNNADKISGIQSTLGSISTLQSSGNAELFEIGKAAAIAQATISTFQAATNALAAVPYPFNFAAAATVAAAGAVQIAHIAETQRPSGKFAEGGIVPGSNFSGDQLTARVNSGEGIFTIAQQKRLFNMANGQDGQTGKKDDTNRMDALISALMTQPIMVQVDGNTIATAVRTQVKGGFDLGVA